MSAAAEHFDAIIVGSGFGGSVTAYRLAEAGQACACSSAAGRSRRAPSRARRWARRASGTPARGSRHVPLLVLQGHRRALRGGLGGGSLIYANVFLRKDENWFVTSSPATAAAATSTGRSPRRPRPALRPRRADDRVQRYPFDERRPSDAQDDRVHEAAQRLGFDWFLPKLAVTFANDGGPPVRRGDRRGAPEPPRPHAHDLPARRRVRRRLQLRRQEHARLQLPHARQAPGRGDPHAPTCAGSRRARAAATRSTTSSTTTRPGSDRAARSTARSPATT